MQKKNIIIWGAGKIGRGFIAELFTTENFHVTFVDQSEALVNELNDRKSYQIINAFDENNIQKVKISDYSAIALTAGNDEKIQEVFNQCDFIVVAVYPKFFNEVGAKLADHILRRKEKIGPKPLDMILCTNLIHAGAEFKKGLHQGASEPDKKYFSESIGIVETLVIRICADPNDEIKKEDPLSVLTNGYSKLLVDSTGFKGQVPQFKTFKLVNNMHAEEKRKLFTYNMFHAVLAYFGVRKGYELIPECIADEAIQKIAFGALEESGSALVKEFNFSPSEMDEWKNNVIQQTNNPIVGDTVFRYAADPIRKLNREDRLIGPTLLCIKHGVTPKNIIKGIAAGFLFKDENDPQSLKLQDFVASVGIEKAIIETCGLSDKENDLVDKIKQAYETLAAEGK
jgi:mannitol-1-phosphate 5-dehydrogenase